MGGWVGVSFPAMERKVLFAAWPNMVPLDSVSPSVVTNMAHLLSKVFLFGF